MKTFLSLQQKNLHPRSRVKEFKAQKPRGFSFDQNGCQICTLLGCSGIWKTRRNKRQLNSEKTHEFVYGVLGEYAILFCIILAHFNFSLHQKWVYSPGPIPQTPPEPPDPRPQQDPPSGPGLTESGVPGAFGSRNLGGALPPGPPSLKNNIIMCGSFLLF